eukprot:GDKJ01056495.1.p1 GENE.GDKJ01056495.1~~GDKJ01056495.1.p1  ORF type:complete len:919 (+),score=316.96 GDKJ01056495.1:106-2757(+)
MDNQCTPPAHTSSLLHLLPPSPIMQGFETPLSSSPISSTPSHVLAVRLIQACFAFLDTSIRDTPTKEDAQQEEKREELNSVLLLAQQTAQLFLDPPSFAVSSPNGDGQFSLNELLAHPAVFSSARVLITSVERLSSFQPSKSAISEQEKNINPTPNENRPEHESDTDHYLVKIAAYSHHLTTPDSHLSIASASLVTSKGIRAALHLPQVLKGDGTANHFEFRLPSSFFASSLANNDNPSNSSPLLALSLRLTFADIPNLPVDLPSLCPPPLVPSRQLPTPASLSPVSLSEIFNATASRLLSAHTVSLPLFLRPIILPSPISPKSLLPSVSSKIDVSLISFSLQSAHSLLSVTAGRTTQCLPDAVLVPSTLSISLPSLFQSILSASTSPYEVRLSIYEDNTSSPLRDTETPIMHHASPFDPSRRQINKVILPPSWSSENRVNNETATNIVVALPFFNPSNSGDATQNSNSLVLVPAEAGVVFSLSSRDSSPHFFFSSSVSPSPSSASKSPSPSSETTTVLNLPLFLMGVQRHAASILFVELDVSYRGRHLLTHVSPPFSFYTLPLSSFSIKNSLPLSPAPVSASLPHQFVLPAPSHLAILSPLSDALSNFSTSKVRVHAEYDGVTPNLAKSKRSFKPIPAASNQKRKIEDPSFEFVANAHDLETGALWFAVDRMPLPAEWETNLSKNLMEAILASPLHTHVCLPVSSPDILPPPLHACPFLCRVSSPKLASVGQVFSVNLNLFNRTTVPQLVQVWLDSSVNNALATPVLSPPAVRPQPVVSAPGNVASNIVPLSSANPTANYLICGQKSWTTTIFPGCESEDFNFKILCLMPGDVTLPIVYFSCNRTVVAGSGHTDIPPASNTEGLVAANAVMMGPLVEVSIHP